MALWNVTIRTVVESIEEDVYGETEQEAIEAAKSFAADTLADSGALVVKQRFEHAELQVEEILDDVDHDFDDEDCDSDDLDQDDLETEETHQYSPIGEAPVPEPYHEVSMGFGMEQIQFTGQAPARAAPVPAVPQYNPIG